MEKDVDKCWIYAKILKPHATKFRSKQVSELNDVLNKYLDEDNPSQAPFIFLIRTAAPDFLSESLLARAQKFKKNKGYDQAVKALKILQSDGHLSQEATYELGSCYLKMSPKKDDWQEREADPCLPLFQQLLKDENFPLFDKVKKDKALDRNDLFYMAFHFMGKLQVEREFGQQLLEDLMKRHPRSKVGKASKKLLALEED